MQLERRLLSRASPGGAFLALLLLAGPAVRLRTRKVLADPRTTLRTKSHEPWAVLVWGCEKSGNLRSVF